jgi:hypothetical protein
MGSRQTVDGHLETGSTGRYVSALRRSLVINYRRRVITVLAPREWTPPPRAQALFRQPLSTRPGTARHALTTRVGDLSSPLRALDAQKTAIEHVFDY